MSIDIDRLADYVEQLAQHDDDRERARVLLRKVVDLAAFPTDVVDHFLFLAPPLYNPGTRRFEFQRTPNKFPTGQIIFAAGGVANISTATAPIAGAAAQDLTPSDQSQWRVLGGIVGQTVAQFLQFRQVGGTRSICIFRGPANVSTPFTVPGNGVQLDMGIGIEVATAAAMTVFFMLFVAEEFDTTARGGV